MNYDLVISKKKEIETLYFNYCKIGVETAIKMGQLLTEVKEQVGHGNFDDWVEANMPFSLRSARRYMQVYEFSLTPEGKDKLQQAGLELTDVYNLLIEHKPKEINEPKVEEETPQESVIKNDPIIKFRQKVLNKLEREIKTKKMMLEELTKPKRDPQKRLDERNKLEQEILSGIKAKGKLNPWGLAAFDRICIDLLPRLYNLELTVEELLDKFKSFKSGNWTIILEQKHIQEFLGSCFIQDVIDLLQLFDFEIKWPKRDFIILQK